MDISNYIDVKLKAIDVYHVEMHPQCHSRSIQNVETLAKLRGFSVGFFAAEAFQDHKNNRLKLIIYLQLQILKG